MANRVKAARLLVICTELERIYLLLMAVLFAASGGRTLTTNLEQEWDSREAQRTALAFFTMALLVAEVILSGHRTSREGDDAVTSPMLLPGVLDLHIATAEKPPPSYAAVMGYMAKDQEAN